MKILYWPIIASSLFLALTSYAVDIIIKTSDDDNKEEKKDEKIEEKIELPEDAMLEINAINQTSYEFALHVVAVAKDQQYQGLILQNVSPKSSVKTLGALFAKAGTIFQFDESQTKVIATSPLNIDIDCEILVKTPSADEETEKPEVAIDEKAQEESDDAEAKKVEHIANSSINFIFYTPKSESFPRCLVTFDSMPEGD